MLIEKGLSFSLCDSVLFNVKSLNNLKSSHEPPPLCQTLTYRMNSKQLEVQLKTLWHLLLAQLSVHFFLLSTPTLFSSNSYRCDVTQCSLSVGMPFPTCLLRLSCTFPTSSHISSLLCRELGPPSPYHNESLLLLRAP